MLKLVTDRSEKLSAQKRFATLLRSSWDRRQVRTVIWRPESVELPISHNGKHWFGSDTTPEAHGVYRFWNSFGEYTKEGNLNITVEINIPIDSNSRQVSGFFATDHTTGETYLMHDGGVGGGRPGIGKEAFLAWGSFEMLPVHEEGRAPRLGLIVAPLDKTALWDGVSRFVREVAEFKAAARSGLLDGATAQAGPLTDYFREFSGEKWGGGKPRYLYESRHGDVVDALLSWAATSGLRGKPVKSQLLDFGLFDGKRLTAAFEVKTSADRQSLYTGIGQLMVHTRPWPEAKKFLVLPGSPSTYNDISRCLADLRIEILTYRLRGSTVVVEV